MVELYLLKETRQTSEHMAEHNTPFSEGTIRGILTDMVKCIRELTLNGNAVKSMKLLAQATGNYTREELNKAARLQWTDKTQKQIAEAKAAAEEVAGNGD